MADGPYDSGSARGYDSLLVVSFGGPDAPDEVMPFLRRVVAGRDVPEERLAEVAEHYHAHGGRSPINDQNRALIAALQDRLEAEGIDLPVHFGNRNSAPFLADALRDAAAAGHRRLLALVTAAYSSRSGCRQYREDIARAIDEAGVDVEVDKVRVFFNHPGFVEAQVDRVRDALAELPDEVRDGARLVFVTHSIPLRMARHCDYAMQHYETARLVAERLGDDRGWNLVYCSRSGPSHVPWLEPDVSEHLQALADQGCPGAVVVPIGFLTDHMEVVHDLDVEAREAADEAGLPMARARTVGTHPAFVQALVDLVRERTEGAERKADGTLPPWHDACPVDCCLAPGDEAAPTVASAPAR